MNLETLAYNLADDEFCMVENNRNALWEEEIENEGIHLSTLYDYIIGT
jgi:uncharacterized protein YutD